MLIVKIIEGHHIPDSREHNGQTFWTQKMYVENGGPFPVEAKLSIPDMSKALKPGTYELSATAFRTGQYGDLEINRYELYSSLLPLSETQIKSLAKTA